MSEGAVVSYHALWGLLRHEGVTVVPDEATPSRGSARAAFIALPAKSAMSNLKGDLADVRWRTSWRDSLGRVRCQRGGRDLWDKIRCG
jgi:hypothetical protein